MGAYEGRSLFASCRSINSASSQEEPGRGGIGAVRRPFELWSGVMSGGVQVVAAQMWLFARSYRRCGGGRG